MVNTENKNRRPECNFLIWLKTLSGKTVACDSRDPVLGMDTEELLEYDPEKIRDEFVSGRQTMIINTGRY